MCPSAGPRTNFASKEGRITRPCYSRFYLGTQAVVGPLHVTIHLDGKAVQPGYGVVVEVSVSTGRTFAEPLRRIAGRGQHGDVHVAVGNDIVDGVVVTGLRTCI